MRTTTPICNLHLLSPFTSLLGTAHARNRRRCGVNRSSACAWLYLRQLLYRRLLSCFPWPSRSGNLHTVLRTAATVVRAKVHVQDGRHLQARFCASLVHCSTSMVFCLQLPQWLGDLAKAFVGLLLDANYVLQVATLWMACQLNP